ncbi:MAG: hypothetical protein JRJ47_02595 [Deltaproteobacteria bacterium]|nr:hypothetical protein [Deltaproteobacteria bacterium]
MQNIVSSETRDLDNKEILRSAQDDLLTQVRFLVAMLLEMTGLFPLAFRDYF